MDDLVLNINQAFQFAALGPCAVIIFYIFLSSTKPKLSFLPVLFFLSLTGVFLFPIISLFPEFSQSNELSYASIANENLLPALSFLLLVQFIFDKPPAPVFWLILAIPFVGGGSLIYLSVQQETVCLVGDFCYESVYLEKLYRVFGSSLMFMLLTAIIIQKKYSISKKDKNRKHKYWLILTVIAFNLVVIATDLAKISEKISVEDADFVKTMVGVGFVYLVLSSVFRVFSESLGIKPWLIRSKTSIARDRWVAERITWILREEKPHRNLGFNRKAMADLLDVKEHTITRVINDRFGKTFSELMNDCRIHDAKKSLRESSDPVTVISFDSGFSSITSFNRVFKEYTGVSPTEYRKSNPTEKNSGSSQELPQYLN